jgi:hypothetical protein
MSSGGTVDRLQGRERCSAAVIAVLLALGGCGSSTVTARDPQEQTTALGTATSVKQNSEAEEPPTTPGEVIRTELCNISRVDLLTVVGQDRTLTVFTATENEQLPSDILRDVLRLSNVARNRATDEETFAVATAAGLHLDRPFFESTLPSGVRAVAWTLNGWFVEGPDLVATSELTQRLAQAGLKVTDKGTPETYDVAPRGGGVGCGELT